MLPLMKLCRTKIFDQIFSLSIMDMDLLALGIGQLCIIIQNLHKIL